MGDLQHPTRPNDWAHYLDEGEKLLWYGRPDPKLQISRASLRSSVLGIGPIIFAVVMYRVTGADLSFSDRGAWPIYIVMALLVAMGLWLLIGSHFRETRKRRHSHYTLTNRRAFIATDDGTRHLKGYPIGPDTPVTYHPGERATIYFARHVRKARNRDESDKITPIGFELIREGDHVRDLIEGVKAGEVRMSAPPGWEGILDEGETILWQGRPDGAVRITLGALPVALFGLAFSGFAVFWMVMASQAGGVFWMFGLIHFSAGLGLVFSALFYSAWRRRHTWYTLSDRRAFIAEDLPFRGRKLRSYPITGETMLAIDDGALSTVIFAREPRRSNKGHVRMKDIGFERIPDGRTVYGLMRQVQKGERSA